MPPPNPADADADPASQSPTVPRPLWGVHPDVIKLGLVSFLTDLSSEMIFSVFAIFFTTVAGASAALLGLVEGLADLSASSLNYFAGWLSDRSGKRKAFALAGYGFSTLAKIILLVSSSVTGLTVFRVIERLGKGFRGPPRDAWLAAVADPSSRGYAFGVHKALDKSGAVLGPLVAYGLLRWLGEATSTYQLLFAVAMVPAVLSIVALSLVKDQAAPARQRDNLFASWHSLSPAFKRYLLSAGVFSLAYFSFSFLMLRAHSVGFAVTDIVLLYALFNVACVVAAPLMGRLSDRIGRPRMVLLGYALYASMSVGFALASTQWHIVVLFVLYGVFYAVDEAQNKAFIADLEHERRATAMGLYNFVTGMLYLPASLVAGALWLWQPAVAFWLAAGLAMVAGALFLRAQRGHAACT
ncbi:MFS transporter [Rhodoferax aquaticus]|uniref:MFS transporter n=1 Tax=Rhodoferax aquaticus TaxID=2527691 RepID=A0A515EK33_9BURK|nr:MFS transporter [Rhodoferax aquaticus]QDL53018.1 MFS transporter [Rhodoferax aquaticus]